MCHEKYHVDPELRAVANRLTGLPFAEGTEQRERCMTISRMLLDRCACEGLAYYLEAGYAQVPSGEANRLLVKLKSIQQRMSAEAAAMLVEELVEEVPF